MGVGNIATGSMKAAMRNMETISNNIANVNTPGFKRSDVNFSEIYTGNMGNSRQPGLGVKIDGLRQNFSAGRLENTDRGLDVALNRDGFLIHRDPSSGVTSYTRAGRMDRDENEGYLYGLNGRIQGFPAKDGVILGSASLVDLRISNDAIPAKATGKADLAFNLNAAATAPTLPFDLTDPLTYNFRTDTTLYDSLGNEASMSVYYLKQADNTWAAQMFVNGQNIGTGNINFQDDGKLGAATGFDALSWSPTGGATSPQSFSLNLTGSTQYAAPDEVTTRSQDGYPSGKPTGFAVDDAGKINVFYSNGQTRLEGQIAIATFNAPQGLSKSDNMSWLATPDSGDPIIKTDNSADNFSVGTLEYSNVDITEELVKLMGAQHDFQASAQIQQTYNQVLQTIEKL